MLLVRLHIYIDLLKFEAYKLFENRDADLFWLLFSKKPTCSISSYWVVFSSSSENVEKECSTLSEQRIVNRNIDMIIILVD